MVKITNQQEEKPKQSSWNWIIGKWRAIFLIGTIILGTISLIGFAEFMYEEASQQAGFGTFQCANALKMAETDEEIIMILDVCMKQIVIAKQIGTQGKWFTYTFGWINPLNWNSYVVYFKGFESNVNTNEKLITFMAEKIGAKLAANTTSYVKMCDIYIYESKTLQFKEADVKGLDVALKQASIDGYSIKSVYNTKIGSGWFTVVVLQKTIVTQEICK